MQAPQTEECLEEISSHVQIDNMGPQLYSAWIDKGNCHVELSEATDKAKTMFHDVASNAALYYLNQDDKPAELGQTTEDVLPSVKTTQEGVINAAQRIYDVIKPREIFGS